jgi:hypothetical protein
MQIRKRKDLSAYCSGSTRSAFVSSHTSMRNMPGFMQLILRCLTHGLS